MAKPKSDIELAQLIASATVPFEVFGLGTKRTLGRPVAAAPLDLSAFNNIIAYEPDELILECGAACKLSDVEKRLAQKNQMLAFEPPNYASLLGAKHAGSIGGALACNLAGPRRLKAGAARDHILGVTGVNGRGEIIRTGARVVKNVTGYDVPRLMGGSFGTLMAFTSVIFKVLPSPETEETCVLKDQGPAQAVAAMALLLATGAEISSAAYVPKHGTYLRIEGIKASVKARVEMVQAAAEVQEVLTMAASQKIWAGLRDVMPLAESHKDIWRIILPPSEAAAFLAALPFEHDYYVDWAGSLIWLATERGNNPRASLKSGVATLFRSNAETRAQADVFHPQSAALATLSSRVKAAFDPHGLFNPGKMYLPPLSIGGLDPPVQNAGIGDRPLDGRVKPAHGEVRN